MQANDRRAPDPVARPAVAAAGRIVVKVGTRIVTRDDGSVALGRLYALVESVAALVRSRRDVLLVSSGAVGLGSRAIGLPASPQRLALRQASAAVGQSRLMSLWEDGLSRAGLLGAQILLTQADFDDRRRYLNLRRALLALLRHGVVPVINENDVVSTEELELRRPGSTRPVFGDNDRLSALVATKLGADLLVLLTDVDGLYDRAPGEPGARLVERVDDPRHASGAGPSLSGVGRGGMRSKVEAGLLASRSGCQAVIASGLDGGALDSVVAGEAVGTWFPARGSLPARRRWIAFAAASRGVLVLDNGAVDALTRSGASLLAAGVTSVKGDFRAGDVVELRGADGNLVGRGAVSWDADAVRSWCRGHPPSDARRGRLIRRSQLVLEV